MRDPARSISTLRQRDAGSYPGNVNFSGHEILKPDEPLSRFRAAIGSA